MSARHKWGAPSRFVYKTERACQRCAIVKVTRHEPDSVWTEFWRDGEKIQAGATPACAAVDVATNNEDSHVST